MHHLLRDGKRNISGLISFFFVEAAHIIRDPRPHEIDGQSLLVAELPLQSGALWYQGIVTKFSLLYDENKKDAREGEFYEQSLTGVIARQSPELSAILRQLDRRRFVCVARDYNGYLKLIGSKENPLTFSYSATTGSSPADRNQVSFLFTGQTKKPSLFLHGNLYDYLAGDLQPDFGDVSIRPRVLSDHSTYRILTPVK